MRFEDLYTPINKMSPGEAVSFFLGFCERRKQSFIIVPKLKKKRVASTKKVKAKDGTVADAKMISVSPAELALLRKAGLIK